MTRMLADVAPAPVVGGGLLLVLLLLGGVVAGVVWLIRLDRKRRGPDGR
ncbi:hypothetical protein [Kitasatospora sp. NPDC093558]